MVNDHAKNFTNMRLLHKQSLCMQDACIGFRCSNLARPYPKGPPRHIQRLALCRTSYVRKHWRTTHQRYTLRRILSALLFLRAVHSVFRTTTFIWKTPSTVMTCSSIFAHINVGRCSNMKAHPKEKGAPLQRWLPSQSKAVTELDCHSRGTLTAHIQQLSEWIRATSQ